MSSKKLSIAAKAFGTWGVFSVLAILANAIKRMAPIALQPIRNNNMNAFQWTVCVAFSAVMLYAEGYKSFHQKFSPLVVHRALRIAENPTAVRVIFAGPFAMGLFGATRKRMLVSWGLNVGIIAIVVLVKKMPYPWRGIVDLGAVAGLTYGALSIVFIYLRSLWTDSLPDVDACMQTKSSDNEKIR